jgi:hypothetical protein
MTHPKTTTWHRTTFPGPRHKGASDFPPYHGSDRSEWMNFFKVSPADPAFMMTGNDMTSAMYSVDGREFVPVDAMLHRSAANAAFSPHDRNVAFLLQGHREPIPDAYPTESVLPGIWRTRDRGGSWQQIYRMDAASPQCTTPSGKQPIVVDPHPERARHIYYGSHHAGLLRSVDDGSTWQVVAFAGHPIKTLDAASGPDKTTILYVVVGRPSEYDDTSRSIVPTGALWRVQVEAEAPFRAQLAELPGPADVIDVAVSPDDWHTGLIIRAKSEEPRTRGGLELHRFIEGGAVSTPARTAADAGVRNFVDVHINPCNAGHVVVRCQSRDLARALQISTDGGASWNPPYEVVDGHIPAMKSYNPGHHEAPRGAMRNESHEGQGPAVGFDPRDPDVVYWWTQNYIDKTPLVSRDRGVTWEPFAYGGPFKQALQIAVAGDGMHMGVGRAEYGIVTTRDGGLSWTGSSFKNDPLLERIAVEAEGKTRAKFGRGLAIKPDDPTTMIAVFGGAPSPPIIVSRDGGLTWHDTGVGAGDTGCVYWSPSDPARVYAGAMRSTDAGATWSAMDRLVLAMSASNGEVVVGTRAPDDTQLSLSLDGGEDWLDLPAIPDERFPGSKETASPVSFLRICEVLEASGVAVDPTSGHDPAGDAASEGANEAAVRILVAGRRGVYEYTADPRTPADGTWRILNEGFEPSPHFSPDDPVPWIAHVAFDPRPGTAHVVYACASRDPRLTRLWQRPEAGMLHANGQAHRPLYRSLDGGRTWRSLHAPDYSGIPDHLDVTAMIVAPDGTLYVDGYDGLYSLPGVSP